MKSSFLPLFIRLAFCLGALGSSLQAQTEIYRETFGNSDSQNQSLKDISSSWKFYASLPGKTVVDNTESIQCIPFQPGNPSDLPNLGTGYDSQNEERGFFYTGPSNADLFLFVDFPDAADTSVVSKIEPGKHESINFRWMQNNATMAGAADQKVTRLAIKVGGKWYVTEKSFFVPNATFDGGWAEFEEQNFTYTPEASAWRELLNTSVDDPALEIGSNPTENLSGDITGIGIFVPGSADGTFASKATGNVVVDTISISVSP